MIQLPNESVYSILTRLKLLNGFSSPSALNQEIFKKGKKRIHSFIPSSLNTIADYLQINVTQLIQNHTLFPVYSSFLSKEKSKALLASMMEGTKCVPSIVIDSKLSINYVFKFCPICAQVDIDTYGVPYWHIDQQLPGLNVCSEHNCLLVKIAGGEDGICNKYELPFRIHPAPNQNVKQQEFSIFCRKLIEWIKNKNDINRTNLYFVLLCHLNLIKGKNSLDMKKLKSHFLSEEHIAQIGFYNAIEFSQAIRLLRHPELDYHPTKHFVTLFLLCNSFNDLIKIAESNFKVSKQNFCRKKITKEAEIIDLYKQGLSLNCISKELVVSRTQVKRILKVRGYIQLSSLEEKVCSLGKKGVHRADIAKINGLSIGYVEQILSMFPDLVELRKKLKFEEKEANYKKAITEYISSNPKCIRLDIKCKLNKEFFWLYQHCPAWLEANLPNPSPPCIPSWER